MGLAFPPFSLRPTLSRALGPARVSAATAGLVEGRAGATALHGLGVDHHRRRVGLPVVVEPDLAGEDAHRRRPGAAVAPAPPLAPHRLPVGEPVGQVPPLAPGPREPQDRVHDVPPRGIVPLTPRWTSGSKRCSTSPHSSSVSSTTAPMGAACQPPVTSPMARTATRAAAIGYRLSLELAPL